MVQWSGLWASTAEGLSLIPGQGSNILQALAKTKQPNTPAVPPWAWPAADRQDRVKDRGLPRAWG